MDKEAQRIAIAEAHKTHVVMHGVIEAGTGRVVTQLRDRNGRVGSFAYGYESAPVDFISPLNYLNDLHAMHEADRAICDRARWLDEIQKVLWPKHGVKKPGELYAGDVFAIANATAAQRAKAFLMTIGKWVGDEGVSE